MSNILNQINFIDKIRVKVFDKITTIHKNKNTANDIVLIQINHRFLEDRFKSIQFKERVFYASLVRHLLEAQAGVIVLNFRHHWREKPDDDWTEVDTFNTDLRTLINQYPDRLVLVNPTELSLLSSDTELSQINIYHHFLPKNNENQLIIDPSEIQGFFDYNINDKYVNSLFNPARTINLESEFLLKDQITVKKSFHSFGILTVNKYYNYLQKKDKFVTPKLNKQIRIKYLPQSNDFLKLDIQDICPILDIDKLSTIFYQEYLDSIIKCQPNIDLQSYVKNKIVIIGFTEGIDLNTLPSRSPFNEMIPAIEIQANIINNLLTKSYYLVIPDWANLIILVFGSIVFNILIIIPNNNLKKDFNLASFFLNYIELAIIYSILIIIGLNLQIFMPIVIPLLTWLLTGLPSFVCLKYIRSQEEIKNREIEILNLKKAEKEAILINTRKILKRTARDIHDGALQQLKLVMDELELSENPQLILSQLQELGIDIRNHLTEINSIASKLEINPFLEQNLSLGLKNHLEQLIKSGKLTLKVIDKIDIIKEPIANSIWFDIREDIYDFFKECINNLIDHAQLPNGNATQVEIILKQEDEKCKLVIINDGNCDEENNHKKGGFGTKIMATIANDLPEGKFQVTNDENSFTVELTWELKL
ncbi:CHASE2 domain-containing protein [Geminocystis sp. CENA526]|uniref:sensor histidine kinase n=1 Tax=Geminocystis sp. CENA526 TaxID=1355871 RepID=UPI003D6E6A3C